MKREHNTTKSWSAKISKYQLFDRALQISSDIAKHHLNELLSSGLLVLTDEIAMSYCYQAATSETERTVSQLAAVYAAHPVTVLSIIFAKPVDKVRLFKETFA